MISLLNVFCLLFLFRLISEKYFQITTYMCCFCIPLHIMINLSLLIFLCILTNVMIMLFIRIFILIFEVSAKDKILYLRFGGGPMKQ